MRRNQMLSLFMLVLGVSLLVAAMTVGAASSATNKVHKTGVTKGGTLKLNESSEDFDYVDPQIAYRTDDWSMLNTTAMPLVGFPEKAGVAGTQLYPIGATSFPTVSKNGTTYTFKVKSGMKFSDGSPVTAAAYQRAFERVLSPKMGSPVGVNIHLQDEIVGGTAFLAGKSAHISGVTAKGQTLTVKLTKPNATFVSQVGMQWFTATKPNTPYTSQGLNTFPSAGPYYIASRDPGRSTVLKRNPYYKGPRRRTRTRWSSRRTSIRTSRCCRSRLGNRTSTSPATCRRPRPTSPRPTASTRVASGSARPHASTT